MANQFLKIFFGECWRTSSQVKAQRNQRNLVRARVIGHSQSDRRFLTKPRVYTCEDEPYAGVVGSKRQRSISHFTTTFYSFGVRCATTV